MKRIILDDVLKTKLQDVLDSCTNYKNFTNSLKSYEYAELINSVITYCPYCNIQSIKTIRRNFGGKGERPDFDHFVPQNGTRENDLSCTNLVPSCKQCNSSYKGSKNISKDIIHPFFEDFDSVAQFSFDVTTDSVDDISKIKILLEVVSINDELNKKTNATIKKFNLLNRYNDENTKSDLKDFLDKLNSYPDIKRKEIDELVKAEKKVLDYL